MGNILSDTETEYNSKIETHHKSSKVFSDKVIKSMALSILNNDRIIKNTELLFNNRSPSDVEGFVKMELIKLGFDKNDVQTRSDLGKNWPRTILYRCPDVAYFYIRSRNTVYAICKGVDTLNVEVIY